jgi:hypothetical protein
MQCVAYATACFGEITDTYTVFIFWKTCNRRGYLEGIGTDNNKKQRIILN